MKNIPIMGRILLALLILSGLYTAAHAQTVGTYTEQNGNVKNTVGVSIVSGTVAQGATATPADALSNTNINASRDQVFNMVFNGTTWDRARGDTNGTVVQPGLTSTYWQYSAAAGGITNSAVAVPVKAAAGAGIRNYVTGMQCSNTALGASTELVILDGATVIWRGIQNTPANVEMVDISFVVPLKGTANTAVSIQTLTAVTGAVYCNLRGFTGS